MKRKALLIGNNRGLEGVQVDIDRFDSFLLSPFGGAWKRSEIETFVNITKGDLLRKIAFLKTERIDYLIIYFSGHGGHARRTVLELHNEELIEETSLRGIAPRQLNIYDCCRSRVTIPQYDTAALSMEMLLESYDTIGIRQKYDTRIMQAIEQQSVLYSCRVGEVSYDRGSDGGSYTKNFLTAAENFNGEFKLVSSAHQETTIPTLQHSLTQLDGTQHPEAILPKCLSAQELIISIRPNRLLG